MVPRKGRKDWGAAQSPVLLCCNMLTCCNAPATKSLVVEMARSQQRGKNKLVMQSRLHHTPVVKHTLSCVTSNTNLIITPGGGIDSTKTI